MIIGKKLIERIISILVLISTPYITYLARKSAIEFRHGIESVSGSEIVIPFVMVYISYALWFNNKK